MLALVAAVPLLALTFFGQKSEMSPPKGVTMTELHYENGCITVFVGVGDWSESLGLSAPPPERDTVSEVTAILSPTCANGNKAPVSSVWPEFTRHLTFKLLSHSEVQGTTDQELQTQLIEKKQQTWGEGGAVKTFIFHLKTLPASTDAIVVQVHTADRKIGNVTVPICCPK